MRKLRPFDYFRPAALDEALQILHQHAGAARILAGGTDLLVSLKHRRTPPPEAIVDLKGIAPLDYFTWTGGRGFRLGALFTIDDVTRHDEIRDRLGMLRTAAFAIGHPQVRSCATVVGNLCNGSPSADMAPPLLALDATLTIARSGATRTVLLSDFYTGPFRTVVQPDEIVIGVEVPSMPARTGGHYAWMTKTTAVDETLVGGAAVISLADGRRIHSARIALGSMAPTPIRAWKAEEFLRGQRVDSKLFAEAARIAVSETTPRRRADYRREMTQLVLERTLSQAVEAAG